MKVDVYLPSGNCCSISLSPESTVSELTAKAQQHFDRRLKLTAKGLQLDVAATLSRAGLQDGDAVDAVVQPLQLAASAAAFALEVGGEVVAWGHGGWGRLRIHFICCIRDSK